MSNLEARHRLDRALSAPVLAITGILLAPSLVAAAPLSVRVSQLGALLLLATAFGVRLRVWRTLTFFAAVVVFNAISPAGRVLVSVLGIRITDGALAVGLAKAAGLTSLLVLSKLTIRPNLLLPGRFGRLLSRVLRYLHALLALDVGALLRRPLAGLDAALLNLQRSDHGVATAAGAGGDGPPDIALPGGIAPLLAAAALLSLSWGAVVLTN
jgi:hypothetical protein